MALAVALTLLALEGRKRLIRSFFVDGAPQIVAGEGEGGAEPGVTRAPRVRVVLIDGLGAGKASQLPTLNELCSDGLDLEVDVGFPTVSLPVQHVLWTGLSQRQSGVWYRIPQLESPPEFSLPARVAGSTAVAESHPEIVHSFGFGAAQPMVDVFEDPDGPAAAAWRESGFEAAATAAVEGPSELVFVHVLRVDEAGHAHGGASEAYDEAARGADALLGRLWAIDRGPQTRWVVLADHGHRGEGGHAGAEEEIRKVRACVRGPSIGAGSGSMHLVDLSRLVGDSLGVAPNPRTLGRPLDAALNAQLDTVPRVSTSSLVSAVLVSALGLVLGLWLPRGWGRLLGMTPVLALASARLILGPITLSHPAVYPPMGRDLMMAMAPALVLAAMLDLWLGERTGDAGSGGPDGLLAPGDRRVLAMLLGPIGLAVGSLVACGGLAATVGAAKAPPLVASASAAASLCLALTAACCSLAAALLVSRLACDLAGQRAR